MGATGMEGNAFDAIVRRLRTRRDAMRAVAAFGAVVGLWRNGAAAEPAACLVTGVRCLRADPSACCSGICKKHRGKAKCAPAGSAQGCTKQLDGCLTAMATPCPHNPAGLCIGGQQGKPVCSTVTTCAACHADADCAGLDPTARCIRGCSLCAGSGNAACVVPAPPT
jgi:hypothetical protein